MEEQSVLTNEDIVAAATNSPALAKDSFILNGKTYPILDLDYDSYMEFLVLLQPLAEVFLKVYGGPLSLVDLKFSDNITVSDILKSCLKNLPALVLIVCRQSDSSMTLEQIKQRGNSPFLFATVVMKQIVKNNMIKDFSDFFAQMAPLVM